MSEKNKIESSNIKLSMLIPYFSAFLIFLGITRLIIFYDSFEVPIVSFLEFSEIITSFLDVTFIGVLFLVYIFLYGFLLRNKSTSNRQSAIRRAIIIQKSFKKRFKLYLKYLFDVIFYFVLYAIIMIVWHLFGGNVTLYNVFMLIVIYTLLAGFAILTVEIERKHTQFNASGIERQATSIVLYGLLIIGFVIFFTYKQIHRIKKSKATFGVTIELDNGQNITSDSLSYYIGNTKNYVFIYNEGQNSTTVIPMNRIKQIILKGKEEDNYIPDF